MIRRLRDDWTGHPGLAEEHYALAPDALRHVEVDMSGAVVMGVALRRSGLPREICRQILELAVPWPQFVGDGPARKRRRKR